MRLVVTLAMFVFLAGCANNPDITMKIEGGGGAKLLMGEFVGSLALITGSPKHAQIHATDGELNCDGVSDSGKFTTDMVENKVTHIFHFTCSNGATGDVLVRISRVGNGDAHGMGAGELNNGSKVRIIVGNAAAIMNF